MNTKHQLYRIIAKMIILISKFYDYSKSHLNLTQFSSYNARASKVPIHLQDNLSRLSDNLEKHDVISPINKELQLQKKTFINSVIILAKGEALKIVLVARYLNSLFYF